ncbi:MAG: hypothetical protein PVG79_13045 [Gemmatimonadales bacterium]
MAEEPADRRLTAVRVCGELNVSGAKYLVIGGVACALHGYIRATTDVDILIERTLPNAKRVLDAVSRLGFGLAGEWLPKEILARPITVIGDDPQIDVFTIAWSVKYEDAVKRSSLVEVEGVPIPLIGIDDLIETKRTGRPLDAADLEALEEIKRLRG